MKEEEGILKQGKVKLGPGDGFQGKKTKTFFLRVQSGFGDTAKNERILRDVAVNQELEHTLTYLLHWNF